jgi:hypothetical protein
MNITQLPRTSTGPKALNPLVFTAINDSPDNPRLGLGYNQLNDPTVPVSLIAKLPDATRVGDTIRLYWDAVERQTYNLDQPTIDKGWLSFNVPQPHIQEPSGTTYYTLYDNESLDLQTSDPRTIAVNKRPPGGLDEDLDTPFNDSLLVAIIRPPKISDPATLVTVAVEPWKYMEEGDELTILWNNIRVNHPKLTQSDVGRRVTVVIPRAVLEQGGSNVRLPVAYEIRDIVDNYSQPARPAFADVEIDPNALTAPRVMEADPITLVLDLEALGDKDVTVRIPHYDGIKAGDEITLTWVGRIANAEDTLTLGPRTVGDPEFDVIVFAIPNARVKAIAGGSAMASYEVARTGIPNLHSKRTAITVTGLRLVLVAPEIQGVNGDVINLVTFKDDPVKVRIAPYLGKQAGDKISLIWTGTKQNGNPVNYTADYVVGVGEETREYAFDVDRTQNLASLTDGNLVLKYQVVFVGTTSPFDSDTRQYQVKGATLVIEDFSTRKKVELIRQGQSIDTDYTTIRFISGPGRMGFPDNDSVPPGAVLVMKLPLLHVGYQQPVVEPGIQTVEIDLKRACVQVECDIYGCNETVTVALLDQKHALIYEIELPKQELQHFSYSSPSKLIHFLKIVSNRDWTYWDNIVMTL